MDENKIVDLDESAADTADVSAPQKRFALPMWLKRFLAPLDDMHHIGLAFIFPVLIMALIYVAIEVFPFGENSVLVLDLNGQYVYYFEAIRDILHGEQGIIYSFERALGGEFLGIVAYYLASPFTFIVALFPEGMITESLLTIFLLKCGLSGMNMCVYLHKSHPTKPVSEVIFSVLYALTSYAVVMQHNTMWIDCLLFFPLIMLGIEELIKHGKYKLFTITLAVAVFSNYYIGYMVCIAVAVYFFVYYLMCTPEERNPLGERAHFIKSLGRIVLFSAIAVGLAAIIILPAYYSLTFGKTTFSNPSYEFKQKFDFLDLITKMLPGSYDTVRPEGLPFIYSGTLTLILLPAFFLIKQISARKKIAYGALVGVFVFSFISSTIDMAWHGFQIPNWLNYRYSFMFCFFVIVMAYKVFEHIEAIDIKIVLGVGAVLGLLVAVMQKLEYENLPDFIAIWFSIACIAAYMIILSGCNKRWLDGAISSILCIFVLLELFCNGLHSVVALDEDVVYSSRTSYVNFIERWESAADWMNETDTSFYRAEKTEHRKTGDNFTLNLRGLTNSTSTLNADQIEFLFRMGYSSRSHWSKYLGGTPVSDTLLGMKYLITTETAKTNALWGEAVFRDEENGTRVYKNDYALSLGYMVSADLADLEYYKNESPFSYMNRLVTVMLGEADSLDVSETVDLVELFKPYADITPTLDNLELAYVTGHKRYTKVNTAHAGRLTWSFTPTNEYEIFVYFPSEYPRDTQLFVNGESWSEFFTNETHRIVSIGSRTANEEISVAMELDKDKVYLANEVDYIYYLDEELFAEVMPELQELQYNIESFTDTHFVGTVTATDERSLLFLTIPYDEGWKVYVDGEETDTIEVLDALTAVELTAGEHTVELKYSPSCVKYGVLISATALLAFSVIIFLEQLKRRRCEAVISE